MVELSNSNGRIPTPMGFRMFEMIDFFEGEGPGGMSVDIHIMDRYLYLVG